MNCAAMRNGSISNWSGLSTIVWIILYKCTRIKISIDERNVLTAQKSTENHIIRTNSSCGVSASVFAASYRLKQNVYIAFSSKIKATTRSCLSPLSIVVNRKICLDTDGRTIILLHQ